MKRRNNRFLAGTLAGLMMLTMLPVTALAAENDTADGTTTAVDDAPVPGTSDSSTVNVVNDDKGSQNSGSNGASTQSAEKNNKIRTITARIKKPSRMTVRTSRATATPIRGKTPTVMFLSTTTAKAARTARKPAAPPLRRAKPAANRAVQAIPRTATSLTRLRNPIPRKSAM